MFKILFSTLLLFSPLAQAQPSEEPTATPAPPAEGRDSRWRHMINVGVGSLSPHADSANNTLNRDYKEGGGLGLGILENYRPNTHWGIEFGTKLMAFSRKSKTSELHLDLTYLALPFEVRYKFLTLFQRSGLFVKGGLTYMILLTASVNENSKDGDGDSDWDDDWDAYPSPPTEGSYRGSFNKTDVLASIGVGADFLLFQVRNSFNMSLIPEVMYYKGLTTISKSGEFGGKVYNAGTLVNLSVAFGF